MCHNRWRWVQQLSSPAVNSCIIFSAAPMETKSHQRLSDVLRSSAPSPQCRNTIQSKLWSFPFSKDGEKPPHVMFERYGRNSHGVEILSLQDSKHTSLSSCGYSSAINMNTQSGLRLSSCINLP